MNYPIPVLGISAYSGTGKTTLLKQLLPRLHDKGYRVGVIKHAHHAFDIDHPGKDSHELRYAGADKILVASRRRMALIEEFEDQSEEPTLEQSLLALKPDTLDIVMVEGFKKAHFPKIELHRHELGKPLMFPNDPDVIAIVCDMSCSDMETAMTSPLISHFKLDQLDEITNFIIQYLNDFSPVSKELAENVFPIADKELTQ